MGRFTGKNRSEDMLSARPPGLFPARAAGGVALFFVAAMLAVGGCSWKGMMEKRKEMPPSPGPWKLYPGWPFSASEAASRQDQTAKTLNVPKDYALDLGNGLSIKFVLIPAGKFIMGSTDEELEHQVRESPAHEVVLTRPYYISVLEITQEQYKAISFQNPSEFKDPAKPVENVSWEDADNFCRKLSDKTGLKITLPTEAQWEFACRSGTETPFSTGRTISTEQANYDGNYSYGKGEKGEFRESTVQAGKFAPNAFGLCDMHGNVWEWCSDWLDDNEYHVGAEMTIDPAGGAQGAKKALRGGCWYLNPGFARSAYRNSLTPATFDNKIGFRVVMEVPGAGWSKGTFDLPTRPAEKNPSQSQPASTKTPDQNPTQNPVTSAPPVSPVLEQRNPPQGNPIAQNPPQDPPARLPQKDPEPVAPIRQPEPVKQPPAVEIRPIAPAHAIAEPKPDLIFSDWPFDKDQAGRRQARTAEVLGIPAQLELDAGGGATIRLSLIPAGRFSMGSPDNEKGRRNTEGPQHNVTISRPFYMGVCEITQAQYQAVMGENPSNFKNPDNPVERVTWTNAAAFCRKLSEKTGRTVRLPTEAQWEYACRAGADGKYCFGHRDSDLAAYCWYLASADHKTHPVGQKASNAFGLCDMHGNVWEWCSDWYSETYPTEDVADPAGPQSGTWRIVRGGAWDAAPQDCRSAVRSKFLPDKQEESYGFRIIVDAVKGAAGQTPAVKTEPAKPPVVNQQPTPVRTNPVTENPQPQPDPVKTKPDGQKPIVEQPQSQPTEQPKRKPVPVDPDVPKGFIDLLDQDNSPSTQPASQKTGK